MQGTFLTLGAAALLLAMPGPTNMLLLAAGSSAPLRRSLLLLPVVFVAYQLAIWPLVVLQSWLGVWDALAGLMLKSIAVAVVLWLAWRLWRRGGASAGDAGPLVSVGSIFWVTLFNPKSLVFAFAILPPIDGFADGLAKAGLMAALVAAAGGAWIAAGRVLAGRASRGGGGWFGRGVAVTLCLFAVLLAVSAARDAALVIRFA
jgi:threonine/homoserine/homoserine lactone efflux protein